MPSRLEKLRLARRDFEQLFELRDRLVDSLGRGQDLGPHEMRMHELRLQLDRLLDILEARSVCFSS